MSRILVYKYIDIENHTDYEKMIETFDIKNNGVCPNFGNKLWYQGIISEVLTPENQIDYYSSSMSIEAINCGYDLMLFPMANVFSEDFAYALSDITVFIKKLSIPVFIISCGIQTDNFDEIGDLVNSIGRVSKEFINAVYETGGDFALRGYYTAEFFSKLGYKSLNVVGCPSLYQLGPDLSVEKKQVQIDNFRVALNGSPDIAASLLKRYNSLFYDQDSMCEILYSKKYYDGLKGVKGRIRWLRKTGFELSLPELIVNDRIRLIADMWDWRNSIQSEGVSLSFGTRIHGNILAVLSGIPAIIVNVDSRVKEMAEFYNIPNIELKEAESYSRGEKNLYCMFLETDYDSFNKTYRKKYDDFNNFLKKCNIVNEMNSDNSFFFRNSSCYPTSAIDEAKEVAQKIQNNRGFYSFLLSVLDIIR